LEKDSIDSAIVLARPEPEYLASLEALKKVVHVPCGSYQSTMATVLTKAEVYPAVCLSPPLLPSWLGSLGSAFQEEIMQDRAPSRTGSKIPDDRMIGFLLTLLAYARRSE
jgi:hypothetical protein